MRRQHIFNERGFSFYTHGRGLCHKTDYKFLFTLMVTLLSSVFLSTTVFSGTRVTTEGIQFPDGTLQTTKAVETGIPGPV